MKVVLRSVLLACLLAACGCSRRNAGVADITLSSCLSDLTNASVFGRSPLGQAGMFSTYDRSGGNLDGSLWAAVGGVKDDAQAEVVNLSGPGCITRIWMTSVPADEWQFFFDGERSPRLTLSTEGLFGKHPPFSPPLSDRESGGYYCYVPIPFEKSIRIVAVVPRLREGSRSYLHVNYETFPKKTAVRSFPARLSEDEQQLAEDVRSAWENNTDALRAQVADLGAWSWMTIHPGETVNWLECLGPGEMKAFGFKLDLSTRQSAHTRARLLRELVLSITWDDLDRPSVEVPFGDFFCNAFHSRAYSSLPMGHVDGTYICRFPMPFSLSAKGELRNDGKQDVRIAVSSIVQGRNETPENYYHARWNSAVSTGLEFSLLNVEGKGHYVGCYLNALGTDGTWNILEGDESVIVDGRTDMQLHGTGLEDYFNGAWYYTGLFDLPIHGLLEKAPIRTDQYRFHALDSIAFNKQLSISFEFGHANRTRGYMSGVAHWYQATPMPARSTIGPVARRFPPADPLAPAAIMAHLFELERIGHYAEARERCLEYAEQTGDSAAGRMIRLRADAYTEQIEGINAVRDRYEQAAAAAEGDAVASHAKLLLSFHQDPNLALLGAHANGVFRLYFDGVPVAEGKDYMSFPTRAIKLTPGPHELTAEVLPDKHDAWLSVGLRTHSATIHSDHSWQYSKVKPITWPVSEQTPATEWHACEPQPAMLPRMGSWIFRPNAFVGMQSHRQLLRAWPGWQKQPSRQVAYFRKRFTITANGALE